MEFFDRAVAQNEFVEEDISSLERRKYGPAAVTGSDDNPKNGFDCNICMDAVQDPVVTLCGHLYCWPCIYKWLQYKSESIENGDDQKQQQCPVCKAEVSQITLVPLYGRGQGTKSSKDKAPQLGNIIPRRPLPLVNGVDAIIPINSPRPTPYPHHRIYTPQSQPSYTHHAGYAASQMFSSGPNHPQNASYEASPMFSSGNTTPSLFEPVIEMFVEMASARIYRNPITNLSTIPTTYHQAGINSPRMRRHVTQAGRSLSRICCFLYCCLFLCLLLF